MRIIKQIIREFFSIDYRLFEHLGYILNILAGIIFRLNHPIKYYLLVFFLFYGGISLTIAGGLILKQKRFIWNGFERKFYYLYGLFYYFLGISISVIITLRLVFPIE